jgi:DNA polymerase I-like protein with 3'-5' exonuclease and polymerase domains
MAKTFLYALIYGAGSERIGAIVSKKGSTQNQRRSRGTMLKRKYYKALPALEELTKAVTTKAESEGIVKAIDGRPIKIRSPHSALNFLLQSAGAIISKAWYVICYEQLTKAGYKYGKDWSFLAHVHDEIQFATKASIAEDVARIATASSKIAGDRLRMRIAIESEYKIGSNWAECH